MTVRKWQSYYLNNTPKAASDDEKSTLADKKLSDIQFPPKDTEEVIDKLSCNAAARMDGFPAILKK